MKTCSGCGQEKLREEFSKNKTTKDGLQNWCRECQRESARRYYEEHSEKIKEKSRCYRKEHLEKRKKYQRRYYEEHLEKVKEANCRWREENRVHKALMDSHTRAKKHGGFPVDPSQIDEIEATYTGRCHYCGLTEEDHVGKYGKRLCIDHDHDIEVSNFRGWLCHPCNVKDVLAKR